MDLRTAFLDTLHSSLADSLVRLLNRLLCCIDGRLPRKRSRGQGAGALAGGDGGGLAECGAEEE